MSVFTVKHDKNTRTSQDGGMLTATRQSRHLGEARLS